MASTAPSITEQQIQTTLGNALQAALPGAEIIVGQQNRIAEPATPTFVIFMRTLRNRLGTDLTVYSDCAFTATAAGTLLTVSAVKFGTILDGAVLFAPFGSPVGLTVGYGGTGSGGPGTYVLSAPLTASTPVVMASGAMSFTQFAQFTYQVDFHSPDLTTAGDLAATITTLFRSELATTDALFNSGVTGVWPLWADDATQQPFVNGEQQYETRWVLDVYLQVNQAVSWPQQFAGALTINFVQADAG